MTEQPPKSLTIDLNADLGEYTGTSGAARDALILDVVTSANIACGVHAGDSDVMRRTVDAAAARSVAIGAHPSFRDREGFGRREMQVPADELKALIVEQIDALAEICKSAGARLGYVKPHGALYNMAARDASLSRTIAEAVHAADSSLMLLGMAGSPMISEAKAAGVRCASEAFADRAYLPSGMLAPRNREWAVLHDPVEVSSRAVMIARERCLYSIDNSRISLKADSICIHGDNPEATELVKATRAALEQAGVTVAPFVA